MPRTLSLAPACLVLLLAATSCTQQQRTDQLRERTADATAAVKRDAKAVAQGIHEGWTRENPLNINSADKQQLEKLPGIDAAHAERIIAHRPYRQPTELLSRKVLTKSEYDQIASRIKVK